jgi:hypothetical protein
MSRVILELILLSVLESETALAAIAGLCVLNLS